MSVGWTMTAVSMVGIIRWWLNKLITALVVLISQMQFLMLVRNLQIMDTLLQANKDCYIPRLPNDSTEKIHN